MEIEVNISNRGFPTFDIVGLPSKEISESKHRILTALQNSGIEIPNRKIVVNLAPADIHKGGSYYDLPIAVCLISAVKNINLQQDALFYGELSLDGYLRHTNGTFLVALYAMDKGISDIYVPHMCVNEASSMGNINVYPIKSIKQILNIFQGNEKVMAHTQDSVADTACKYVKIEEVIGQESAKRAL